MIAGKNRVRLALEQMEDRCTPSALPGAPWADFAVDRGGPQAAQFGSRHGPPDAESVEAKHDHVFTTKMAFQCSADLSSLSTSVTGLSTHLGHWTGQGHADRILIDPDADRGTISGTLTVVTANGDQLFVMFTTSWQLSTGQGHDSITVTGGTGRFAGASGSATLDCTVTADPVSGTFACNCEGTGTLILAH
jgi:hypothetical protein